MHSNHHSHHESKSASSHKEASPQKIKVALFTVSSSRFRDKSLKDESGEIAKELLEKEGHEFSYSVIDDSRSMIRLCLFKSLFEENFDAAIFLGGTGLSPRDVTVEAISPLLDKRLDGYGEIFRRQSYESIGSPAVMSRAMAGTIETKVVFCLPGSPDASGLGMELILKELRHAVFIARGT
jgi:molybdopterin adenylyltransferase